MTALSNYIGSIIWVVRNYKLTQQFQIDTICNTSVGGFTFAREFLAIVTFK